MKKLVVKANAMKDIMESLQKGDVFFEESSLQKSCGHKYIYRFPAKNRKGWDYVYPEDLLHPIKAIKRLWGFDEKKITTDYEKNNIKKDFGADKKTFAAHVLEYFSNKIKWDQFFAKKENREKTEKPQKMNTVKQISNEKIGAENSGQLELVFEKKPKTTDNKPTLNRSLMRKVYNIYNKPEATENEREQQAANTQSGSGELPAGTPAVRAGGGKGNGNQYVSGGGATVDGSKPVQPTIDTGGRSGRDVRVTKGQAKEIREASLNLLASKTDEEMTDEDKALLRQYEGAGGLGGEDSSVHGTLYEFYTPTKVVNKVWDIVHKYAGPAKKNVLEPSAGIGRFAEGRSDNFTLCELDKTSARISKILHPEAEVRQGAFQEMFMSGGVVKQDYTGKKYDVVIGNPPYGKYEGLHKGRGEGKDHSRYEEYFIDRGLDTLREGGIMAFVVPSSFLRGGSSKIKEKIAKKGRLLEAWRLPNGTFNTTGIGTDIIILRFQSTQSGDRDDGNISQTDNLSLFANNAYFEKNPAMIIGDETTRNGKFGQEQYVALRDGDTFDDAIDRIKVDAVQAIPIGDKTDAEKAKESVKVKAEPASVKGGIVWPSRILSALIPLGQLQVTRRNPEAFSDSIKILNEKVKSIPKLYSGENLKEHPIALHYFTGNTDIYITEWDGKDTFFGYTILNGDTQNAEWGYSSLSEIMSVPSMNLDYIDNLGTVEAAIQRHEGPESEAEAHRNRSEAMKGNQNAKKDGAGAEETPPKKQKQPKNTTTGTSAPANIETDTIDSFNKKYNRNIPAQSLPVWRATAWDGKIDMFSLSPEEKDYVTKSGNYVVDRNGNWMDKINFASGNIYQKLQQLEDDRKALGEKNYTQQKEILEAALPPKKKIGNFIISPISGIAKSFKVQNADGEPIGDLRDAFIKWAYNGGNSFYLDNSPISQLEIGTKINFWDILDYILQKPVITARSSDASEREDNKRIAEQTRELRKEAAERIFNRFIREGLSEEDQKRLEDEYNHRFNAVVNPDYARIPIFIDGIATMYHGKPLVIKDQQLKGASFLVNKGNGVNAYDVGVGKTMVGIMATVSQVQSGRAKKPLVCVPKAVYKKWIKTFHSLFPGMKINELGNLSKSYTGTGELNIEEGSISVCTYEALENITFREETVMGELMNDILESQKTDNHDGSQKTQREASKEEEKIMTMLGIATKNKNAIGEGAQYWEDIGFDHITVDECFPYDTPVLTEKGWMKIGDIVEKEEKINVYSYNFDTGLIELKPIISWMPKRLNHKIVKLNLSNGESVTCTHNHNIWTEYGYVRAEDISGQNVFMLRKNLPDMREGILLQILRGEIQPKETLLFKPLCSSLPEQSSPCKRGYKEAGACNGGCNKGKENDLSFNQNERKQPHEEPGNQGKSTVKVGWKTISGGTLWEWEIYKAANSFNGITQFASGICDSNTGNECAECSELLQSRSCHSREKDCHRIGREFPQTSTGTGSRQEENCVFERVRVESVEVLERGSYEQYGFRSNDDSAVYDIEVADNHNFIANGVLVSNCHNFKNVFASAKPQGGSGNNEKEGRIANEFQGLTGAQSARGLKLFAITQLIQKNNNDRNVFGLSATPFTNSPIEIYNILSLVARKKLKDMGIYNLHEFMAQFAELKSEWAVVAKGEIQRKQVMKNFKNLSDLQALITEYIDKVDGEEAGIIRPRKKTHITQIRPTSLQKQIIAIETERMNKASKKDKGATLVALNNMRMAMLSPALLEVKGEAYKGINLPGPEEVVTSSPKLQFVCDSVTECYKHNSKNSQIIYMPRGTDEYTYVKQYLVDHGIPPEAVAFMNSKTSLDAKEKIKNDFNDVNGTIKVIIGSETIKEGVSLNGNTTTIYNTCLGWNPTETIQVEGRAWRQGNKQGHVHVIYPLMNDSVDSFMYQKHSEKASRLDAIYSYKGDMLNVEDIDPEELKFSLIKDPEKRAKFKIDMLKEEVENKRGTLQAQVDIFVKNAKLLKQAENTISRYDESIGEYEKELAEIKPEYDDYKAQVDKQKKAKTGVDWLVQSRMERAEYHVTRIKNNIRAAKNNKKAELNTIAITRAKFDKMGVKTESDIERKEREMLDEIRVYADQLEQIEKDRDRYVQEAKAQIEAESVDVKSLDELIKENVNSIITDLRPMDEVKAELEAERELKKSILLTRRKTA